MDKKIALVTGSNRGIGLEVLRQLCELGYHSILTSRKETDGAKAMESLAAYKSQISHHLLEVRDAASITAIQKYVEDTYGRLDILVNNAGWNYDIGKRASSLDLDTVSATLDTNLLGPWRMCQAFIPLMKKHQYGRIVNVSSGSGAISEMNADTPAYSVSKTALNVLTIKLAKELAGTNILVNSVCPGWVRTDMGGANAPRSVAEGAEGIVWLATLPSNGPSGGFFRDKQRIPW
ncbi:MAG: SDR family oxidoreductase [Bacteroidota bacterium]